jgi:hypothetical protein
LAAVEELKPTVKTLVLMVTPQLVAAQEPIMVL